jgi:hypothetical protein
MEDQLLGKYEVKSMPYSKKGEFNFCNIQSFEENDPQAIKNFAANVTVISGGDPN